MTLLLLPENPSSTANWLLRLPPSLFATISFAVSHFFFLFLSYYQFQLHRSLRSSLMVCSSALGRLLNVSSHSGSVLALSSPFSPPLHRSAMFELVAANLRSRRQNFVICHLHTTSFSAPLVPPRTSRFVIQIGEICGFDAAELSEKSVEIMKKFSEQYARFSGTYLCVDKGVTSVVVKIICFGGDWFFLLVDNDLPEDVWRCFLDIYSRQ
ncbi:hypothetical protein F2Q70_00003555 [Brassica cretica]|uniref:Ferredoxin-thioredoxin reductase catalytic chain, chloroplastic n=1 Tax=Brassica cretica TaxID=69181 RepID=A0A8S9J1F7_BRACR|nr:hypothetical protein F2Q70_00003555 [Brassica cretica]